MYAKPVADFIEEDYSISTAWTFPSWLGRFVILALPASVSIIAPFIRIFCLARNLLEGVSRTFFILAFLNFPVFLSKRFAISDERSTVLLWPPLARIFFFRNFPSFTILACLSISYFFFFL